jgi:hypothetical protein
MHFDWREDLANSRDLSKQEIDACGYVLWKREMCAKSTGPVTMHPFCPGEPDLWHYLTLGLPEHAAECWTAELIRRTAVERHGRAKRPIENNREAHSA